MKNKIGVGVVTCNRQDFFKQCIDSIPEVDELVVVNDGDEYPSDLYPSKVSEVIQHKKNMSVGISKNQALRHLMNKDCDHLFLIEDDMLIKNPDVFKAYIKGAEASGIWHLNFGYHGPANKTPDGQKNPRQIVEYEDGVEIALNPNCVGSFSYYLRNVIKHCGYMDEAFNNAWEHVEHTYKIIKAGLHPPFWWFADLANSDEYIGELDADLSNSLIRKTKNWNENMQKGMHWYAQKHGVTPVQTPDTPEAEVMEILENIEKYYARRVLD